jgi:hypothetical protein
MARKSTVLEAEAIGAIHELEEQKKINADRR